MEGNSYLRDGEVEMGIKRLMLLKDVDAKEMIQTYSFRNSSRDPILIPGTRCDLPKLKKQFVYRWFSKIAIP